MPNIFYIFLWFIMALLIYGCANSVEEVSKPPPPVTTPDTETPVFTSPNKLSVAENITNVMKIEAVDPNNDPITYTLEGGADLNLFSLNQDILTFTDPPNFEAPTDKNSDNQYEIIIGVSDDKGHSRQQTVTISVVNANDAPILTTAVVQNVNENSTNIAQLSVDDEDNDAVNITISGGLDAALFSLVGNTLAFITAPDYENPSDSDNNNNYEVNVKLSDGNVDLYIALTVIVNNLNDNPPIIYLVPYVTILENTNGAIDSILVSDPDGDAVTLSLQDQAGNDGQGADQGFFQLSGKILSLITAPDFENPLDADNNNTYVVELFANDGVFEVPRQLTVAVQNVSPLSPQVTTGFAPKQIKFSWPAVAEASYYQVLENPDGVSGFSQIGADIPASITEKDVVIPAIHLKNWVKSTYAVTACEVLGCSAPSLINSNGMMLNTVGYFKASNSDPNDFFGETIALSVDGNVLAVGSRFEQSAYTIINGNQQDNSATQRGAVYIFERNQLNNTWTQKAYLKPSVATIYFGTSIALTTNGDTIAVGAASDTTLNTPPGAVFIFNRIGDSWIEKTIIQPNNIEQYDLFGTTVALSREGDQLAVGAPLEDSASKIISTDHTGENDNSATDAGAVYVFNFNGSTWDQNTYTYIKATNANNLHKFGTSLSLFDTGNGYIMAVSAIGEDSAFTGVSNDHAGEQECQTNLNCAAKSGAVYLFVQDQTTKQWSQQMYFKASNAEADDLFGAAVSMCKDGVNNILAVGAPEESSSASGVSTNPNDQLDNGKPKSGAVYLFQSNGGQLNSWSLQTYIKSISPVTNTFFGSSLATDKDCKLLAVGEPGFREAYLYSHAPNMPWQVKGKLEAPYGDPADLLGQSIGLSDSGETLVIGAPAEASDASGISAGDPSAQGDSAYGTGAVYLY